MLCPCASRLRAPSPSAAPSEQVSAPNPSQSALTHSPSQSLSYSSRISAAVPPCAATEPAISAKSLRAARP